MKNFEKLFTPESMALALAIIVSFVMFWVLAS
jgi:hypothetical protein